MNIAERIRLARVTRRRSQADVAKVLGLHREAITEIEMGRRRISAEELGTVARFFGIYPGWFYEITDFVPDARPPMESIHP